MLRPWVPFAGTGCPRRTDVLYYYCPEHHDVFRVPPAKTVIWRYQTLPKLISVLDARRLFLCRASKFQDPFEGAVPKRLDDVTRQWSLEPESYEKYRSDRVRIRDMITISCWHRSAHESAAMWSLYGLSGEGVAIKSTVGRLAAALPKKQTPRGGTDNHGILIGHVDYIDYATADFPPDNIYYPYVHKRLAFQHEREVRAVTMITDAAQKAFDAESVNFEITKGGLAVPIDIETMIEAVYISPLGSPSFERVVRATLQRFGVGSIPVIKSPMAEDPIY
jgi:hypothetical protein